LLPLIAPGKNDILNLPVCSEHANQHIPINENNHPDIVSAADK
jgi:hypothetical protein